MTPAGATLHITGQRTWCRSWICFLYYLCFVDLPLTNVKCHRQEATQSGVIFLVQLELIFYGQTGWAATWNNSAASCARRIWINFWNPLKGRRLLTIIVRQFFSEIVVAFWIDTFMYPIHICKYNHALCVLGERGGSDGGRERARDIITE